jgi:hypothetical protein
MEDALTSPSEAVQSTKSPARMTIRDWAQAASGWDRVVTPPLNPAEQAALSDPSLDAPPTPAESNAYRKWLSERHDLEFAVFRLAAAIEDERSNAAQRMTPVREVSSTPGGEPASAVPAHPVRSQPRST